jgi:hypothetical protein
LWDLKSPALTTDVPHTREGDKRTQVSVGGAETGAGFKGPSDRTHQPSESSMHTEHRLPSARTLGIPMPLPTIKPLIVAIGIIVMFTGALMRSAELSAIQRAGGAGSTMPSLAVIILGAIIIVLSLYWWLLSPLEEHHP